MRTVEVVELAGDLWTDGGTDGRSDRVLDGCKPTASGQTDRAPLESTLYRVVVFVNPTQTTSMTHKELG